MPSPRSLQEELGKSSPFESLEQEVFLNLARTASELMAEFSGLCRDHALSEPQYNVLRIVAGAGKGGTRTDRIARHLVSRGPDVTRLVDRLEASGLVRRRRDPEDGRIVQVVVTPRGQRLLDRLHEPVLELHRRQFAHLDARSLAALNQLLFRVRHSG